MRAPVIDHVRYLGGPCDGLCLVRERFYEWNL
jgi:hypothetical protein